MSLRLRTFDARATFLSGDEKGTSWGLQSWKTYLVDANGKLEFEENDDAKFILAAEQYLLEFPFRANEAELVAYAGERQPGRRHLRPGHGDVGLV